MAFETRQEAWQRGRFGQCLRIRLTLMAASLATLPLSVHAWYVAVRSNATQIARLFGAVGPGPTNLWHLVRNGPKAPESERVNAAGSGFGLRVTRGSNLSIKLNAAWSNKPAHTGDTDRPTVMRNFRLHGPLVYVF